MISKNLRIKNEEKSIDLYYRNKIWYEMENKYIERIFSVLSRDTYPF